LSFSKSAENLEITAKAKAYFYVSTENKLWFATT